MNSTIVCMVHLAADEFCNASVYPRWYAEFELAIAVQDTDRTTGSMSYMVPGNHGDAGSLWWNWDFAPRCPELVPWSETMWPQLDRNRFQ